MKKNIFNKYSVTGCISFMSLFLVISGCSKIHEQLQLRDFNQVNLVANNNEFNAAHIDPAFLNGWGLAFGPSGVAWVSAATTGLSEVWDSTGTVILPAVTIPAPGDATTGGHP